MHPDPPYTLAQQRIAERMAEADRIRLARLAAHGRTAPAKKVPEHGTARRLRRLFQLPSGS